MDGPVVWSGRRGMYSVRIGDKTHKHLLASLFYRGTGLLGHEEADAIPGEKRGGPASEEIERKGPTAGSHNEEGLSGTS